jgi:hypothetical protein
VPPPLLPSPPACLFTVLWGITPPPLQCVFLLFLLIIQFFLFSLGGGWSVQGAMPLSSPCGLLLPKQSGCWCLAEQEPSWSLHLTWSGSAKLGLGVWKRQRFASPWWFFL